MSREKDKRYWTSVDYWTDKFRTRVIIGLVFLVLFGLYFLLSNKLHILPEIR